MTPLQFLRGRGYVEQVTEPVDQLDAALQAGSVTFYIGFDPTADSLHVGHLLPIMTMANLQRLGHRPIAIIGGGTGRVGDPSGKTEMRKLLDDEAIAHNMACQQAQIGRYVRFGAGEGDALMIDNGDWLNDLRYVDFLREIGRYFKVNVMIKAEGYRQRLEREEGLSFLEFNYQILQAYDFLVLRQRHDCRLQLGGNDQWGNITAGTELIRRVEGSEAWGLTWPLLTTAGGKKMGKTEKGAVWLDAEQTSPFEFSQYWRNVDDADVARFFRLFTFLEEAEIVGLTEARSGVDLNEAKVRLAREVTTLCHGEAAALEAEETAKKLFAGGNRGGELTADALAALPAHPVTTDELADGGLKITDALVRTGLAKSKGEARRLCRGGGIRVWDEKAAEDRSISADDARDGSILLAAGKKRKARLVLAEAGDGASVRT